MTRRVSTTISLRLTPAQREWLAKQDQSAGETVRRLIDAARAAEVTR